MRCESCSKFVSFEERDPEVSSVEVSPEGHVVVEVGIVNECAECGQDLKSAEFQMEADCEEAEKHLAEIPEETRTDHQLEAEENGSERTSKSGYYDRKTGKFVNRFGRYAKHFYGASVDVLVSCSCGEFESTVTLQDEIQASGMDEC